jgi:hypothetical protein
MNKMCLVLTMVFLLSACSEQQKPEVPAVASKKTDEDKIVINDIKYKLLFEKGSKKDKEIIDYYLNEIEMYSNYIDNEIGSLQKKNSEVIVFFKKGKGETWSTSASIDIYEDEEEYFYLTAGALFRANYKNVADTKGSFAPHYIISEYYSAKYESEQDPENQFYVTLEEVAQAPKKLDLTKLWNDQEFLHTYSSNWNNYLDGISFIDYLMKTYGKKKTLKIVAENNDESLHKIFGKSLVELEREWKQAK